MPKPTRSSQQLGEYIKQRMLADESIVGQCGNIGEISVTPAPGGGGWEAILVDSEAPPAVRAAFDRATKEVAAEYDLIRLPYGASATRL